MTDTITKDKPIRFRVIPSETGMMLRNLIARRLANTSRDQAAELIHAGGVYVNRIRIRIPSVRVAAGERITVYRSAAQIDAMDPDELEIVHRDPYFIVVNKAPGIPVSATKTGARGTLSEAVLNLLKREGNLRPYVGVVHRLDRRASGLVLFTIRDAANQSFQKQFVEHRMKRRYRVRVRGNPPETIVCQAPLVQLSQGGVRVADATDSHAISAVTHFFHVAQLPPLRSSSSNSSNSTSSNHNVDEPLSPEQTNAQEHLMDVELETGRTHQIRAHAHHLGIPLVGERRYVNVEDKEPETPTLCLHAWKLEFRHPINQEPIEIECPLPAWAEQPTIHHTDK